MATFRLTKKGAGQKVLVTTSEKPTKTSRKPIIVSKKWHIRFAVCRQKESCDILRRKLLNQGIKTFIVSEVARFPDGVSRAYKLFFNESYSKKETARKKIIEFKNGGIDCAIELRSG